jgi:hypothetical protein
MKNRRDLIIIISLFVVLILFVAFGPQAQPATDPETPTTRSAADGGARALFEWVQGMGYDARRLEYREFELSEEDDALFILNPSEAFTQEHAEATLDWVEQGGTLIFADDTPIFFGGSNQLFEELQIERDVYSDTIEIERAPIAQPAFDQPPVSEILARTGRVLVPQRNDYVKLVGMDDATVVAGVKHGQGYMYISSSTYPFTVDGLRNKENARFVLNVLRRVPVGGRIQFDEYHHGYVRPPSAGPPALGTPWGWAMAYALLATVFYLALNGRRFGRPIPLKEDVALRSSAEYVESMADLFQRGGKRSYIGRHYHTNFKRRLAKPYGINPQIDDDAFVRELARVREIDEATLSALLARLRSESLDEAGLVRVVGDMEAFLQAAKR